MIKKVESELRSFASKEKANSSSRFFKTGKGEYGHGDLFLGISTPQINSIVKKYRKEIDIDSTLYFLKNKIHDFRVFALKVLRYKYKHGDEAERKKIFELYLDNLEHINNWDLVDISAPHIVGEYLTNKDKDILYELARSNSLWKMRVAIISTLAFIKDGEYEDTLKISKILLVEKHDLIHKAVGWMLREVWKKEPQIAEKFIKDNYDNVSRTSLRYAIEKMEEKKRKEFLKKNF